MEETEIEKTGITTESTKTESFLNFSNLKNIFGLSGWAILLVLLITSNFLGNSFKLNQDKIELPSFNQPALDLEDKEKNILDILKSEYIGKIPTENEMEQGKLAGLVASFNDKYTTYYTCDAFKKFEDDLNQNFEGIGAKFTTVDDSIVVDEVLKNSPAEASGLKKGDNLILVDGVDVDDLGFSKVIQNIRGKAGTSVSLDIDRPKPKLPDEKQIYDRIKLTITRKQIHQDAVTLEVKNDTALITVSTFSNEVDKQMAGISSQITQNPNVKKIVLDLRDNGGGLLNQSILLVSYFVPEGQVVVQEKSKTETNSQKTVFKAINLRNYPLAVLVNNNTASASEITAGAIQDYKRGQIIGKKTFGKGVVQTVEDLDGCNKLKVTTAEWLTPTGRSINEKGVMPDVKIKAGEDYFDKAVEVLK